MDFLFRTTNSYVRDISGGELKILSTLSDFAHIFEVYICIDMKTKVITDARAAYHKTPYGVCQPTKELVSKLIGLTVKKGVLKDISAILATDQGCIHLFELVENAIKLASTILIGKHINYFSEEFQKLPEDEKIQHSLKYLENTCLAYYRAQKGDA